jgi:riboflavin synthase
VKRYEESGNGIFLTISSKNVNDNIKIGDSISIDGACQTVTGFTNDSFTVFASKITCEVTTLGEFKIGRKVNLERAMSVGDRYGGHIVQGHVDGKGKITSITKDQNGIAIEIAVPKDMLKYIVAKGSIAVDGISLTVVSLTEKGFSLYIIPETIINTTLNNKAQGSEVNIETDILAKYVESMLGIKKEDVNNKDEKLKRTLLEEGYF